MPWSKLIPVSRKHEKLTASTHQRTPCIPPGPAINIICMQFCEYGHRLAGLQLQKCALKFYHLWLKAGFNPDQPRVPRGHPHGGRWTHTGVGVRRDVLLASARGRRSTISLRIAGRSHDATPAQTVRLSVALRQFKINVQRTRKLDPNYEPPAGAYSGVEGYISHLKASARHAEAHFFELQRAPIGHNQPAPPVSLPNQPTLGATLREVVGLPPAPGGNAQDQMLGTVAMAQMDGNDYFGANSTSIAHTNEDFLASRAMRYRLVQSNPDIMNTENLGLETQ